MSKYGPFETTIIETVIKPAIASVITAHDPGTLTALHKAFIDHYGAKDDEKPFVSYGTFCGWVRACGLEGERRTMWKVEPKVGV